MPDVSWTLAGSSIDYVAAADSPSHPAVTPGAEREWTVAFTPNDGAFVVGEGVVGEDSINGGADERHAAVLELTRAARSGTVAWETTFGGDAVFHEEVPAWASVDTLVGHLAPDGAIGRSARWVLVVGGEDASPSVGPLRRARLRLVDLAPASWYPDVSAVQTDLEADTA